MSTDSNNEDKQKKPKELDDTLAWLEELALDDEPPLRATLPPKTAGHKSVSEQSLLEDQLSWLDELSADEEPLEEQPTLSWEHTKPTGDLLSPSLPLGSTEESGTQEWDDAISWLEELSESQDETTPEELEELLEEQEEAPEPPPVETRAEVKKEEKPAEKKSKGGGLFGGEEDFSVSAEELAAAAAHGAEVEGFDFPDDDEAAIAWLEGLIGNDILADEPEVQEAASLPIEDDSLYGDLLALADEAEEEGVDAMLVDITPAEDEILLEDLLTLADEPDSLRDTLKETKSEAEMPQSPTAAPAEPSSQKPKRGGMFGAEEDFSVSAEELAAAAAHGAEVEGFDFPDDDEAAMAWLEGLIGGDMFMAESEVVQEEERITAEDEALENLAALTDEAEIEEESLFGTPITLGEEQTAAETERQDHFDELFTFDQGEEEILDELLTLTEGQDTGEYLLDVLGEVELQVEEEIPAPVEEAPIERPVDKPKRGGMFGAEEDFSVSAEELAAAAAHGAEVEGFDFPDDDEAAMAWLEGLIGGDDLEIETVQETSEAEPVEMAADTDENLLGDLLALAQEDDTDQQATPSAEDALLGELMALAEEQQAPEREFDAAFSDSVDEDEDNPLAWLDEINAEFESTMADDFAGFPAVEEEDDVAIPNFDLSQGIPTDPEVARELLERLAAEQDDSLEEELGVEELDVKEELLPEISEIGEQDKLFEQDVVSDFDLGIGDASLSWLEDADEPFADLPEDPDEAMDFLEQLSTDGEVELHDDRVIDELLEADLTMEEVFQLEEGGQEAQAADTEVVDNLFPEAVSSALPDWLAMGTGDAEDTFNALDWLDDSSSDGGILGWLESEEEVSQKGPERPMPVSSLDTFDLIGTPTSPPSKSTRQSAETQPPKEEEKVKERPVYDPAVFRPARSMLLAGDIEGALEEYEAFLDNGRNIAILVDELEQVVGNVNQHPLVRRLLGDAYMRNGQLQEALSNYILSRDQL